MSDCSECCNETMPNYPDNDFCSKCGEHTEPVEEELKTLKDIAHYKRTDGTDCEGYIPDIQELKREAIKWVKHCLNNGQTEKALVLIEFMNLTEDDIK